MMVREAKGDVVGFQDVENLPGVPALMPELEGVRIPLRQHVQEAFEPLVVRFKARGKREKNR